MVSGKELGHIGPNGITEDYCGRMSHLPVLYETKGWRPMFESLRIEPLPSYANHYPESQYIEVITNTNRQAIAQLDEHAERINALAHEIAEAGDVPEIIISEFISNFTAITKLLHGHERSGWPKY